MRIQLGLLTDHVHGTDISIYLSVYLSIYYLSIYLHLYLLSTFYLSIYQSNIYLSILLSLYPSVHLSIYTQTAGPTTAIATGELGSAQSARDSSGDVSHNDADGHGPAEEIEEDAGEADDSASSSRRSDGSGNSRRDAGMGTQPMFLLSREPSDTLGLRTSSESSVTLPLAAPSPSPPPSAPKSRSRSLSPPVSPPKSGMSSRPSESGMEAMSCDASEEDVSSEATARGGHEKAEEVEDEESGQMSNVESLEDLEEGQSVQELAVTSPQANAAKPHLQGMLCRGGGRETGATEDVADNPQRDLPLEDEPRTGDLHCPAENVQGLQGRVTWLQILQSSTSLDTHSRTGKLSPRRHPRGGPTLPTFYLTPSPVNSKGSHNLRCPPLLCRHFPHGRQLL